MQYYAMTQKICLIAPSEYIYEGKREISGLDMTRNIPNNWKTIDFGRWIMI